MRITNEFASVMVEIDSNGNSHRLKIQDCRTGRVIYLDALQLESLTRQSDEIFREFLQYPFGPEKEN
ncbi:hypothetical protein [Paenibacillus naphthalenovorans]|uniref:hypothetical protein n=1 Tax=Paenibacillus naphthalenovorans TaxID=162209 RepID=UPI003D2D6743